MSLSFFLFLQNVNTDSKFTKQRFKKKITHIYAHYTYICSYRIMEKNMKKYTLGCFHLYWGEERKGGFGVGMWKKDVSNERKIYNT